MTLRVNPAMTLRVWARPLIRHARLRAGHPRLHDITAGKTWMAGINPAMTLRVNPAMTLRVCARPLIRHARPRACKSGLPDLQRVIMRKSGTPDFRWHPRLHDIAAGKTWMAQQADLDGRNKSGHDVACL